jgi:hypothetical protein
MDELGDSIKPVYEITWPDGTVRRTDNIEDPQRALGHAGVEFLKELVEYHCPEAEIEHVGYES